MSSSGEAGSERQEANSSSSHLSARENETIFRLLGRKCQSMSTAVVEIYKTEGSEKKKKRTGVICFIKDSCLRSYFIRAYCLVRNELLWEHEVRDTMKLTKTRTLLLTFEGQDGIVDLNFTSVDECDTFYHTVQTTIETRNRKHQERSRITAAPNTKDPKLQLQRTNVVGTSSQGGSTRLKMTEDKMLTKFLNEARVTENEMSDRDTRAFIFDFMQSNNGLASVKSERVQKYKKPPAPAPPPVPSRRQHVSQNRTSLPPPVPTRQLAPRIQQPPSRPVQQTTVTTAAAVPSPPPTKPPVAAPRRLQKIEREN